MAEFSMTGTGGASAAVRPGDSRRMTARSLLLDCLAVEVGAALAGAGIRTVLLKGAAIADWLYDDGAVRPYGDTDLLVSPNDFDRGESELTSLGFTLRRPGLSSLEETAHARVWVRHGQTVDLHQSLWGIGAKPATAWNLLTENTEVLKIGGGHVEALATPARILHIALHAAQHGTREAKPLEDLARSGLRVPFETWCEAAELARALGAEGTLAAGLRQHPHTAGLADALGLTEVTPLAVRLHAGDAPVGARGLMRVATTSGLKAKAAMAARRLVPTAARMRARYPFAARGFGLLILAYIWRTASLVLQAPAAVVAIKRARKAPGGGLDRPRPHDGEPRA